MSTWSTSTESKTHPRIVERATSTLPQGVQGVLFTVLGRVLITAIIGEVTTAIENQANATRLIAHPTVGADVNLCATLDIDDHAVGTMYNITGTLTDALVATVSGAMIGQAAVVVIADGTIDLECAASNTGAIKWTLHYVILDDGSNIT